MKTYILLIDVGSVDISFEAFKSLSGQTFDSINDIENGIPKELVEDVSIIEIEEFTQQSNNEELNLANSFIVSVYTK